MSRSRTQGKGMSLGRLLRMRSLGSIGVVAVLAFYVAWPLYAGYEINSSLDEADAARLAAKVDFPSVRTSLQPAVARRVEDAVADLLKKAGPAGAVLAEQLKDVVTPPIVDAVLAALVTPEMLIRIHASGKSFKEALDSIVLERASQAEGLGGYLVVAGEEPEGGRSRLEEIAGAFGIDTKKVLGGLAGGSASVDADTVAAKALPKASGRPPRYGFDNIKHVSLAGPFGLSVGVARDPKAKRPDLTAELSFVNGAWMLTGLIPGS